MVGTRKASFPACGPAAWQAGNLPKYDGGWPLGPTFTGILDQLSTQPIHAWSHARVLSAAWLGNPIIRLRRDSDSVESDFGADDAGDLDTAAIATFLGADTAHVAKIYDQVGSADLLQATTTRQFVYSSSLAALNGRAVASMAGGNGFMTAAASEDRSDGDTFPSPRLAGEAGPEAVH